MNLRPLEPEFVANRRIWKMQRDSQWIEYIDDLLAYITALETRRQIENDMQSGAILQIDEIASAQFTKPEVDHIPNAEDVHKGNV